MDFDNAVVKFWQEFGLCKKMVLSTSQNDIVTSRMMSVVILDRCFYFQTDTQSRKYMQLKENPQAALCIDNIQIEGTCTETGRPAENSSFCELYEKCFPGSFKNYTNLLHERLFRLEPTFIERWLYIDGKPYMEKIDLSTGEYLLKEYDVE